MGLESRKPREKVMYFLFETQEELAFQFQSEGGKKPVSSLDSIWAGRVFLDSG